MSITQVDETFFDACRSGDVESVRHLLNAGAGVNARDEYGYTPLHAACFHGHPAIVRLLIEAGADVNAKEKDGGYTPLHYACLHGRTETVRLLLEAGADPNARSKRGLTPLDLAMKLRPDNPHREEIIDLFREHHPELVFERFCQGPRL